MASGGCFVINPCRRRGLLVSITVRSTTAAQSMAVRSSLREWSRLGAHVQIKASLKFAIVGLTKISFKRKIAQIAHTAG